MARESWFQQLIALIALIGAAGLVQAQTPAPTFVHGLDYTFERMLATRTVRDTADQGSITLVAYVYRPVGTDRPTVVLWNHGSTGGGRIPAKEPILPPRAVVRFFVSRGYTVVAPMRRGRGESSGTSLEECGNWAGRCTLTQQIGLLDSGLREAILDLEAITDRIVQTGLTKPNSKFIFSGVSRGGFLALAMAAEHPEITTGVVNFVGGWFPVSALYPADINDRRLRLQLERLTSLGGRSRAPTLWIYADRDHAYSDGVTRQFFTAYRGGGGSGKFHFIASHALESGHRLAEDTTLWTSTVAEFLNRLR